MKLLQRLESCSLAKATVLQPIGDIIAALGAVFSAEGALPSPANIKK
jgi:hypothetical protein